MSYNKLKIETDLKDLFSLKGRTALVVGGAGLLGSHISLAFAELGANVIIASRDIKKCQEMKAILKEKYPNQNHVALSVDITAPATLKKLFEDIVEITGGHLDILANSGWYGQKNTFESISEDDWQTDIDVCLSGVFRTIKSATPLLKKRGGSILNIASMYGHVAPDYRMYDSEKYANPPSYGAAKAGVIQLTKYLSSFLSPDGIRVNCISPGAFPFEKIQKENPEFMTRLNNKNPLNRIGKPHELKGTAALLCSDAGSYITGQNICIDGGWTVW